MSAIEWIRCEGCARSVPKRRAVPRDTGAPWFYCSARCKKNNSPPFNIGSVEFFRGGRPDDTIHGSQRRALLRLVRAGEPTGDLAPYVVGFGPVDGDMIAWGSWQ